MATKSVERSGVHASEFVLPASHRTSWGAIIAGVSLLLALAWLFLVLGTAIGVGVADASDLDSLGEGLGLASILWILLSMIGATFCGALLAAKMAGTIDDRIGALHGLTVWSIGMLIIIVMAASGIGGAMNAVGNAISSASQVTSKAVVNVSQQSSDYDLPESLLTNVAAVVKRQASNLVSEVGQGSNAPSQQDVREGINSLSANDAASIAGDLVAGNLDEARDTLTQRTSMTDDEIESIIEGAENQAEQWNASSSLQQAQQWLNAQINTIQRSASRSISNLAGSEVSRGEISNALEQLDSETMMQTGQYLVMGEPEMAKNVLTVNTNLSEADIEAIVNGAEQEVMQVVERAQAQINEATEAVGTYTQAVLWSAFIASALGLVAGAIGGYMGAGTVRKLYVRA